MSGSALVGCPRFKSKPPARTFQAGKQYTSSDGTLKADIVCVRRGTYSTRVLVLADGAPQWCEIGHSGGAELFTIETKRGVYVILAGGESHVAIEGR